MFQFCYYNNNNKTKIFMLCYLKIDSKKTVLFSWEK